VTWLDVQAADFNGDGKADLAAFVPASGGWWVAGSGGAGLTTSPWGLWPAGASWADVHSGHFA
jgi:hypothetical protein